VDLDDYFVDDYREELHYTYLGASNINVNIVDSLVTLSAKGSWYGTDWIVFVADDTPYNASSTYNASSNNVTLIVEYQAPEEVPTPYPVHRPRVLSLQVIVDEIIKVGAGNSSRAKVLLYNDGDYDLHNINLSATTNETNITLWLQDTFITDIKTGKNVTTWLNITLGQLEENRTYLAHILADVESPVLSEMATITIKVTPTNVTKVIIQIVMVKDLFEENPECMELFGLIVEAEESLKRGSVDEARRLTTLAMENCQDMIDYAKLQRNETALLQPSIVGQMFLNPFFVMGFVLVVLSLAMVGYWLMSKRQVASTPKTVEEV
jgi:hypothetical protein